MSGRLFGIGSICCVVALAGCESNPPADKSNKTAGGQSPAAKEEGHSHGAGPHGGTIADWGGDYHVEFTVDHDKQQATVYVLGGDSKTPAPVKADKVTLFIADPPIEAELAAQPLEGESEGTSSRFVGTHENLGKVQEYEGTINAEIDGIPYSADFKEVAHEHKD